MGLIAQLHFLFPLLPAPLKCEESQLHTPPSMERSLPCLNIHGTLQHLTLLFSRPLQMFFCGELDPFLLPRTLHLFKESQDSRQKPESTSLPLSELSHSKFTLKPRKESTGYQGSGVPQGGKCHLNLNVLNRACRLTSQILSF